MEAVGLSNYGPKQLAKIKQFLDSRGIPLAAVQVQYSLLRQVGGRAVHLAAGQVQYSLLRRVGGQSHPAAGLAPPLPARAAAAGAHAKASVRCRQRFCMSVRTRRACTPCLQPRHRPGGGQGGLR